MGFLACIGVISPFPFYYWLWRNPQTWVDLCGRERDPCKVMALVSHFLKVVQFISLFSVSTLSWPPPFYFWPLFIFGQFLNFRLFLNLPFPVLYAIWRCSVLWMLICFRISPKILFSVSCDSRPENKLGTVIRLICMIILWKLSLFLHVIVAFVFMVELMNIWEPSLNPMLMFCASLTIEHYKLLMVVHCNHLPMDIMVSCHCIGGLYSISDSAYIV